MVKEGYFIYNGKFFENTESVISADNRSFRYGDGFFETMLCNKGNIHFWEYHKDRINDAIIRLQFDKANHFSIDNLTFLINKLIHKNKINGTARVRINFFRGDGGLFDPTNNHINYIIQTWAIQPTFHIYKENGLQIDFFPDGRKACDSFSSIKSNNYLTYAMAALWAKKAQLNDAVVLNQYDRIADTTIANIFMVDSKGTILTPKLSEGCVNGIIRRHLLENSGREIQEAEITQKDLLNAQEIFLTNAIKGISWVGGIGSNKLTNHVSKAIYMQMNFHQYM